MPDLIRVDEHTPEAELMADLRKCSAYPRSEQRTASVDVLLDLVLSRRDGRG